MATPNDLGGDAEFLDWLLNQVDRTRMSLKTALACAYRRGRTAGIDAALAATRL